MKKLILFLAAVCTAIGLHAQSVDTVAVFSPSMQKEVKAVVILPDGYDAQAATPYPVVYLLHGYSGDHRQFLASRPELPQDATDMRCIIVCPDGGYDSWYWDSPKVPECRYETFITRELVPHMDKHYHTLADRTGRAITGNSMGGHGALWCAFRNADVYGACGSIHGGVDIRPFPDNWGMKRHLGEYFENPQVWDDHSVVNQLYRVRAATGVPGGWGNPHLKQVLPRQLAIIIDCGTDDFFFDVNAALHEKMLYYGIVHDYIVRPGTHSGNYASNALSFQLLFFKNFFAREKAFAAEAKN